MFRIDTEGSINGQFSEGNPSIGIPGTKVSAEWLNDLQETICYVIESAGLDLVKGDNTLLANAILNVVGEGGTFERLTTRIENLNASYLFGASRIIRSATMPVNDPSNPFKDNDIWVDISQSPPVTYIWNSLTGTWVNTASLAGGQAAIALQMSQAIADGSIEIFLQEDQPTTANEGDLWYSQGTTKLYVFNTGLWVEIVDEYVYSTVVNGIIANAAKDARGIADSKIKTYWQSTPPSGLAAENIGDLWFDVSDGNKLYRWNGSSWELAKDANIDRALSLLYLQSSIADGTITVYFSEVAPTSENQAALVPPKPAPSNGDIWVDISLNGLGNPKNDVYLYTAGNTWVIQTDPETKKYLLSFANAASIADGSVTFYYSTTPPSSTSIPPPTYGDIWFNMSLITIDDPDAEDPSTAPQITVPKMAQYRYDPSQTNNIVGDDGFGTFWIPVENFIIKIIQANLKTISKTFADADTALASQITEATTSIGNNTAAIQSALVSINGIAASYGIITNVNNKVVGFGFLTDFEGTIEFTKTGVESLDFRPGDQIFSGSTWETRTYDAIIVSVDNVSGEMRVISQDGTYSDGLTIKTRDNLNASGTTVSYTENPTPGTSEFNVVVDSFKITDASNNSYTPFSIVGGVVYVGAVDTSTPALLYIGEFSTAPATTSPVNSIYRNSTNGNTYILQYISGSSGPKQWNLYIERGANAKYSILTSDTPFYTFQDNIASSPLNSGISFKVTYKGMPAAYSTSDIKVYDADNVEVTGITYSGIVSDDETVDDAGGQTHQGTLTFILPYTEVGSENFPIKIKAEKDSTSDDIVIYKLIGSTTVVVSLAPDSYFYLFEDDVATVPQNTTIGFQIRHQNLDSAPVSGDITVTDANDDTYSISNFVAAGSGTGVSTFDLDYDDVSAAEFPLVVEVSTGSITDIVTIRKLIGGVDAVTGMLTNEAHSVPADETGTLVSGALDNAIGQFNVYQGTQLQNSACTFSVYASSGATASINSDGAYSITAMSANQAFVTFQALYDGVPIRKIMSLTKAIAGTNARELYLSADSQTYKFDGNGVALDNAQEITFTATIRNLSAPTWSAINDQGVTVSLTNVSSSANQVVKKLSITDFINSNTTTPSSPTQWVKVVISQTHNAVTYSDVITVVRLVDGSNALTVILSNENTTFDANEFGTISGGAFASGNTTLSVFRGIVPVNYNSGGGAGNYSIGTVTASAGVTRNNSLTIPEFGISALSSEFGYLDIPVIYYDPVTASPTTVTKRVSYSKARKGFNAHSLQLTTTGLTFEFDSDNNPIDSGQTISIEALTSNVTLSSIVAKDQNDNTLTMTGSGSSRTFSITQFGTATRATITATGTYTDNNGDTQSITDTITIVKLKALEPPVSIILTNESHTFSADASGTVSSGQWSAGNSTIRVFRGGTELTYNAVTTTPDSFAISSFTATNVTRDTGISLPTVGINAMSADTGSLSMVITYTDSNGTVSSTTYTKRISYAKAKTGTSASSIFLNSSAQYYIFDAYAKPANTSDSITFTATPVLLGGTPVWTCVDQLGNAVSGLSVAGDSLSATLSITSVQNIAITSVTVRATIGSYYDQITVPKLQQGADTVSVFVQNEAQTLAASEDGVVSDYSVTETTVKVFRGTTEITYASTPTNNRWYVGTITSGMQNNVVYDSSAAWPQVRISNMTADSGTLNIPVIYQNTAGGTTTYNKVISYVKSRRGIAARNIQLIASAQTFNFDGNNNAINGSDSITFTAIATSNITITGFTAVNNAASNITLTGSGTTRSLSIANFGSSQTVTVTVTGTSTISGVATSFSDSITIVRLRAGADGVQVVLSNEAHTFYADETGAVVDSYSTGNSSVRVFQGASEISYSSTLPQPNNTWNFTSSLTGTNVTPAAPNTGSSPVVVGISAMTSGTGIVSGSLTIPITFKNSLGQSTNITKTISYTKSLAGTDARSLQLVSSAQAFIYNGDGTYNSGQVITIDAITAFISGALTWTAIDNNGNNITLGAGTSGYQKTLSITNFQTNSSSSVTVTASKTDAITGVTYQDKVTIVKISNGSNGLDAVQIVLTNESHTFAADELGVVSNYTSGNCNVLVYSGSTSIPYSATKQNNTFRFGSFSSGNAVNVTRDSSISLPMVGINAMSDVFGSLRLDIIYTNGNGTDINFSKIVSYTKSIAGSTARGLRLTTTTATFSFNGDNSPVNSSQSALLTAYLINVSSGTLTWSAIDDSGNDRTAWLANSTSTSKTLAISNFTSNSSVQYVTVTVSGSYTPSSGPTVNYSDSVRIFRLRAGSDAITVVPTNTNHSFFADESGVVQSGDFVSGNCTFTVYRGTTQISYDGAGSPANDTWKLGSITATNVTAITPTTSSTSATVGINAFSSDNGTLSVPIIYKNSVGANTTLTTIVSYSRIRAGRDARWISITPSTNVFRFDGDNIALLNPDTSAQSITLTLASNLIDPSTISVSAVNNSEAPVTLTGSGTTRTLTIANFGSATFVKITASVTVTVNGQTQTLTDTTTISRLRDGSDNIQVVLSNEAHTFVATEDGIISSLSSGDCAITVYRGSELITQNTLGGNVNNQWKFGTLTVSAVGSMTATATGNVVSLSSFNVDSGLVTVPIIYTDPNGNNTTINRIISYSKSREGKQARGVDLFASGQVFLFTGDNSSVPVNNSDSITFTAVSVGLASLTWTALNDTGGSVTLTGSGDTRTLTISNFGVAQSVVVTVSGTHNAVTYTDKITIYRIKQGANNLQYTLTNEAHTFNASEDGTVVNYSSGDCTVIAYKGGVAIPYYNSSTNPTDSFVIGSYTTSNVTRNTLLSAPTVGISNLSQDNGYLDFSVYYIDPNGLAVPGFVTPPTISNLSTYIVETNCSNTFNNTLFGYSASASTATPTATGIDFQSTGSAPRLTKSGLSFSGMEYQQIIVRLKRIAGSGNAFRAYYSTSGHSFTASYIKNPSITIAIGQTVDIVYDMHVLTSGGTDWRDNIITGLRFEFGNTAADRFEVQQIQVVGPQRVVRRVSYAKSKAGVNSRSLRLISSAQTFRYNAAGTASPSPQTITLTASSNFISGTVTWTAVNELSQAVSLTTVNSTTRTVNNTQFGTSNSVTVTASVVDSFTGQTFEDKVTIVRVADGATGAPGAAGASSIQPILSNENTTFAATEAGVVSDYSVGDCIVTFFVGNSQINYNAGGGANTWKLGTLVASGVTLKTTTTTSNSATVGISAMSGSSGAITVPIIYTNSSGVEQSAINQTVNYTKAVAGVGARYLFLSADKQVLAYTQDGLPKVSNDKAIFTPYFSTTLSSVTWTAVNDTGGNVTLITETGGRRSLDVTNFGSAKYVTVSVSATDTSGTYTDRITVARVIDGSSAITIIASNDSHTFKADEYGTVQSGDYTSGNCLFQVYRGGLLINYNAGGGANTWRFTTNTGTNITSSIASSTGTSATIGVTNMTQDAASVSIVITYTDTNSVTSTYNHVLSYTKARAGVVARNLTIAASGQVFRYDGDGLPLSAGDTINFTASGLNLTGPYSWVAVNQSGSTIKSASANSFSLSIFEFGASTRATITATSASVVVNGVSTTFSDSITVYKLNDATANFQTVLTNEAHVFVANSDGYVTDYTGGNCQVIVYKGLTAVNYNATKTANTWRFGTSSTTGLNTIVESGVTRNAALVPVSNNVVVGISMMSDPSGYLELPIIYTDGASVDYYTTKRISYTKVSETTATIDGVTVLQTNPSTTYATDKNGVLLAGVNYSIGDSVFRVFVGDEELAHSTVAGLVNTFRVSSVTATGVTRNNSLTLPTVGISAMSADTGKLDVSIIPYIARTDIVNYGFELGANGTLGAPIGWTLSGTNIAGIGYDNTVLDSTSIFKSTMAFGKKNTTAPAAIGWQLGKRFSVENSTYITVKSIVRPNIMRRISSYTGGPDDTHAARDDVYIKVVPYDSNNVAGTPINTITASHYYYYVLNRTGNMDQLWLPYSVTVNLPVGTVKAEVYFMAHAGNSTAAGTVKPLGYTNTTNNVSILLDDIQFLSDGALYDTTIERTITQTVNYARARTGQDGANGENAVQYYIKPTSGTALKNGIGTLTGELRKLVGATDSAVSTGSIKLYDGVTDLGYTYSFDGAAITGSKTILAKDGSTVLDSITLLDVSDGLGGGSISSNNGLSLVRPSSEIYSFSPSSTTLTGSFYAAGTTSSPVIKAITISADFDGSNNARMRYVFAGGGSSDISTTVATDDGSTLAANTYSTTRTLTVKFTYTDPGTGQITTVSETVYRVDAGIRGSRQFYATGTSWSDITADNAISATGTYKVLNDIVTISSAVAGFSQTRFWDGAAWQTVAQVINGNLVVQGTLGADRIASGLIQTAIMTVGADQKLTIDGSQDAILVKDGSDVVRVKLGKLGSGQYGITIYNAAGEVIMSSGGGVNWDNGISGVPTNLSSLTGSESIITEEGTAADSRTNSDIWRNGFEVDDFDLWVPASGATISKVIGDAFSGSVSADFTSTLTSGSSWPGTTITIPRQYSPSFSGRNSIINGSTVAVNQRIEVSVMAKKGTATSFAMAYRYGSTTSTWQVFTPVADAWRTFSFFVDVPPTAADQDHYISIIGSSTGGGLTTRIDNVTINTVPAVNETQGAGFWAELNNQISAGNISTYFASAAIGNAYIANLSASKITTDNLVASVTIGVGSGIVLDGPNKRITVGTNIVIDGTNNYILFTDNT